MTEQQLDFLNKVTPRAVAQQRMFGIPACITIAQAILESAAKKYRCSKCGNVQIGGRVCVKCQAPLVEIGSEWGGSVLFRQANNPFGIKYAHRQGAEQYGAFDVSTSEFEHGERVTVHAAFQQFSSLDEAFTAHSLLLMRPNYRPAYVARCNWQKFAERLGPKTSSLDAEHCGYSTNPSYSAELVKIVMLYDLDDSAALETYTEGKAA